MENKAGNKDLDGLKEILLYRSKDLNFKQLIEDVTPFLINQIDSERVKLFPEFIYNLENYVNNIT